MQPLHQDDLDKGEISFAQMWRENVQHLEQVLADVRELPKKLGAAVGRADPMSERTSSGVSSSNTVTVLLKLSVEDQSLSGRNKTKVRQKIENEVLARYQMVKPRTKGGEYELTIPFEKEDDISKAVLEILWEMDLLADLDDCFLEHEFTGVVL